MEFVSFRSCTRNWNTDERLESGGAIDPLKSGDAMVGCRDHGGSQVDKFGLEARVDSGAYGPSIICNARGREGVSFANVGTTGGHIHTEGVKGEGGLLTSGAEGNAYVEGVKGEGKEAIFSGRGGTGGISTWRLSCGGTKAGP